MPVHPARSAAILGFRHRGIGDHARASIPLLEDAAGGRVEGLVGDEDPFLAVATVLETGSYDEIIVSTLPARVSHWLHIDLPTRLQRFGLSVTVITAKKADRPLARARHDDHR